MSRCTETDKPQISILMAIYDPRMDWLREQLLSLNNQTYSNIKLYIRDDCSPMVSFDEIQSCVKECIRAFPYEIKRNEKNLGSNKTFECLTREADGVYFAYCDQDDIWLPEKLEKLHRSLSNSNAELICSDVIVIDGFGRESAGSITELRRRHVFCQGDELAPALIYRNFVIGCTMLICSQTAKEALPFAVHMVHDHYLAFFCALRGGISVHPEVLVRYRIHGGNQTSVLAKVVDRASYLERHMIPFCRRVEELHQRFELPDLSIAEQWANARVKNSQHSLKGMLELWKLRNVNKTTTLFELVALRVPKWLFRLMLHLIQAGKI